MSHHSTPAAAETTATTATGAREVRPSRQASVRAKRAPDSRFCARSAPRERPMAARASKRAKESSRTA
jgi:hypothetical protein